MDRSPATFIALLVVGVLTVGYFVQKKTHPEGGEGGESGPVMDPAVLTSGFGPIESAIAAQKGKVVLLDCWATWCGPCVSSFPKLVEKQAKYGDRGLVVISVNLDEPESADEVAAFLKHNNATFTNIQMKQDRAAYDGLKKRLGYRGSIPHAALINRKGERVWAGHPMKSELEEKIEAELSAAP